MTGHEADAPGRARADSRPPGDRSGPGDPREASDPGSSTNPAALARINPKTRTAGTDEPNTGVETQLERLNEAMVHTRRQLKALYNRFQESRGEPRLVEELLDELRQAKARIAQLDQRVSTLARDRVDLAGEVAEADVASLSGRLAQDPLSDPTIRAEDQETARIDRFLRLMVERGASDMHLSVGCAPLFRDSGDIEPLRYRRLRQEDWERLIEPITPDRIWSHYRRTGDADFAYEIPQVGRFRVNLFRQERGGGAVFRVIPTKILTIDQLALPEQVRRLTRITSGLVLVTGPTGSGKSTTLAAIIDAINEIRCEHIITLEDPIEFVHASKRCLVHQREIGTHSSDFATGLMDAVREDPNLLLVGEMRDMETIRLALESAEKGLLVFGTLHTNNAAKTVDRIINTFPADEQETIRSVLSDTCRAILAQQLLRRVGGGRIAAVEVLFGSPALANLVREGKTHQITNLIQTGRRQGMVSMDESLTQLVQRGLVAREAALEKAIDKSLFRDPQHERLERQTIGPVNGPAAR